MSREAMQMALEALKDALSVCRSVSTCKTRRTREDGVTMYAQTEEWCRWVEDEVGLKVNAAGDALIAALAEQAQPVACKFSRLQVRNLWNNSPEHRGDATSFAAFARIVRLVEEAHRIGDNARTPPAPVVPSGRKLVPVEPTEAMLSAAQSAWLRDPARKTTTMYRSMLAAAPEAPSPPVVPQPLAGWELARVIADAGADELAAVSGTALLRLIRAVEAEVLKRVGVQR